jgi:hypothetical protein
MSVSVAADVGSRTSTAVGWTTFNSVTTYSNEASAVENLITSFFRMCASGRKKVSRWAANTVLPPCQGNGVSER